MKPKKPLNVSPEQANELFRLCELRGALSSLSKMSDIPEENLKESVSYMLELLTSVIKKMGNRLGIPVLDIDTAKSRAEQ